MILLDMMGKWELVIPAHIPKQRDGINCGVYMLLNIEILTRTGNIEMLRYDHSDDTLKQLRTAFENEIRNRMLVGDYFKELIKVAGDSANANGKQTSAEGSIAVGKTTVEESKKSPMIGVTSDKKQQQQLTLSQIIENAFKCGLSLPLSPDELILAQPIPSD